MGIHVRNNPCNMLVYTAGISHHTAHVYIHFLVSFIAERVQHETEDLQEVLQGERERGRGGEGTERVVTCTTIMVELNALVHV